jgi:hypothetical protein
MSEKPIRVFYSPLTKHFYATQRWKDNSDGTITVTGKKYDVTQDVARAVIHYQVEFVVAGEEDV